MIFQTFGNPRLRLLFENIGLTTSTKMYKDVQSIPNFNSFRTFTYHVESVPGPWDTLHPEHIRFFGHQR